MKTLFIILITVMLAIPAFSYNSAENSFQSDKQGYQSNKGSFKSNEQSYSSSSHPIRGYVNGVAYREYSDLHGLRDGFVPLILPAGTQMKFSAMLQDFIGDNPPRFLPSNNSNGLGQWDAPEAEMYLALDDYFEGKADTDPGVIDARIGIRWIPMGNNRVKFKVYWEVETTIINPQTRKLYMDYGTSDYRLTFTDNNGGTFTCEHDRGKSIDKKILVGNVEATIESFAVSGNFVIALPDEPLRDWGDVTGADYVTVFTDSFKAANSKPLPISEKYFETDTLTVLDGSGQRTITTMEQYAQERLKVVNSQSRFIFGSHCRLDPLCLTEQDDASYLNYPVIDPQFETYSIKTKIERDDF
jgi:hypothetical protein